MINENSTCGFTRERFIYAFFHDELERISFFARVKLVFKLILGEVMNETFFYKTENDISV